MWTKLEGYLYTLGLSDFGIMLDWGQKEEGSKCWLGYANMVIDSDWLLMANHLHFSSPFFLNTFFFPLQSRYVLMVPFTGSLCLCTQSDWQSREGQRGQCSIYPISSETGKLCITRASLTLSHFEHISLGLSFFLGFQQTWRRTDLLPQARSTLIINMKDGHSTGRAPVSWPLVYAPQTKAYVCIFQMQSTERLLTQRGKKPPGKQGAKS